MKDRQFEDFLQERHSAIYPMVLDDDLPDSFDTWLAQLDYADYIDYANLFAKERFIAGMDRVIKMVK